MTVMTAAELLALEQGSEGWRMARVGYASSSEFSSILAKGQGKMRASYLRRIVAERLTGKPSDTSGYGSWASNLERGHEQEPDARMSYESISGNLVTEVGIIRHPLLMASCSCDGLINDDGGAEIKCVIPTVQLETLLRGGYPPEHKPQIQGCLWLTGRQFWDFCSYSPDMPEHLRTYIFRVERDDTFIATLASEVAAFCAEADAIIERLGRKAA